MRFKPVKSFSFVLYATLFFSCRKPFSQDIRRFVNEAHCVKTDSVEFLTLKEVPKDKNIIDEKRMLTKLATSPVDPAIQFGVPYKVYSIKDGSYALGLKFAILSRDKESGKYDVLIAEPENGLHIELKECIR